MPSLLFLITLPAQSTCFFCCLFLIFVLKTKTCISFNFYAEFCHLIIKIYKYCSSLMAHWKMPKGDMLFVKWTIFYTVNLSGFPLITSQLQIHKNEKMYFCFKQFCGTVVIHLESFEGTTVPQNCCNHGLKTLHKLSSLYHEIKPLIFIYSIRARNTFSCIPALVQVTLKITCTRRILPAPFWI